MNSIFRTLTWKWSLITLGIFSNASALGEIPASVNAPTATASANAITISWTYSSSTPVTFNFDRKIGDQPYSSSLSPVAVVQGRLGTDLRYSFVDTKDGLLNEYYSY